jgi:transketolase
MARRSRDGAVAADRLAGGHHFNTDELQAMARELRRDIVQTIFTAGSGHPGGSLSELDILVALYFRVMRHDPANPQWPDRDRFILSKGHASSGLYAVLARAGYFPKEELSTFRKLNSRLQGHAHPMTPGVEMNSGSLGMGLSFALGCALAARLDHKDYLVYVLLGDGECDEGQVWEAAMAAAHHKATNLIAFVDRNRIQNDRFTDDVMSLEPLAQKWRSFGWRVLETDGHDFGAVLAAIDKARRRRTRPTVIIAHTVKGKGVSFMENNPAFHGRAPNRQEFEQAMKELA